MEKFNLSRLQNRYGGRYVALWKGRVVASARTNGSLLRKILPAYRTRPYELLLVPRKGAASVYSLSAY